MYKNSSNHSNLKYGLIIDALCEETRIDICFCVGIKEACKHLNLNPCEMLLIELLNYTTLISDIKIVTLSRYKHHVPNSSRKTVTVVKSRIY